MISTAQVLNDFRSVATGNWGTLSTWQYYNGTSWVAAIAVPTNTVAQTITIQSPNVVTVAAAVTVDQVLVNSGATLQTSGAIVLTIANGTGDDLIINGTFIDGSSANISWSGSTTWLMGVAGTLIKTTGNSDAGWQGNYSGGINTIPSSSNWVLRKTTAANPVITTIAAYYPNLTIENNVIGTWTTATTSTFQGTTGFPTIKGNFDIGGSGTSTIDFLNGHTFATASLVQGNTIIRTGNTLRNYGTGLEMQGDLTVSGTVNYAAGTGTRKLIFSGGIAQSISGAGTLNIRDMTMSKSANSLTLNRAVTIDNVLTMTTGIIYSTSTFLLTVSSAGSVTGTNNSSFVSGPVRYTGAAAFTFPVGKGSDYQALSVSATTYTTGTFWTEDFENSCTSGCLASTFTGVNGAWTIDNSGGCNDTYANKWFVSCSENGNTVGSCGSGCGTNETMHIGADDGLYYDPGAAYDAGGYGGCGFGGMQTYTRAVSPLISTVGKYNITLNLKYIENGDGTNDDAWIEYSIDGGTTWALLVNPGKTATGCCFIGCQGIWANLPAVTLPSAAENISNLRIRFVWQNNDDAIGSDPSFAVNDMTLTSGTPTVDFTCEYFYANPQTTFNNVLVPSLNHISLCEYWTLTRNSGTANKNVTLTWDANSCGVTLLSDLRVAHWDGAVWQNEGNSATTGSVITGTITSNVVTWFSPFTLASISAQNPLPVELLSFVASYNGNTVDLNWNTATETNNDYFTVERTTDGNSFVEIVRVKGAGNSSTANFYQSADPLPLDGASYYRLKQTDYNGNFSYSDLSAVEINKQPGLEIISVHTMNKQLESLISCACKRPVKVEIIDVSGKTIYSEIISVQSSSQNKFLIDITKFTQGIYLLKVSDENEVKLAKFVL